MNVRVCIALLLVKILPYLRCQIYVLAICMMIITELSHTAFEILTR